MRPEPDDGGRRQPLQGRVAGKTAARASSRGASRMEFFSTPPRLEAYVQHTTRPSLNR